MLVLQKAVKMAWSLPKVMCIAYAFILVMLSWMALWSFGAAGVVASSIGDSGRWWLLVVSGQVCSVESVIYGYWVKEVAIILHRESVILFFCFILLQVLSISLFWTGAVLCNTVHVIVSGMVFLVLFHGGQETASMPPNSLMKSLRYAVTTSFGSICYGSLFTAAIRTLRWEVISLFRL